MGNAIVEAGFADSWMWLIFIGIGLVMILAELILGVATGLDLVFIGTACILGGLISLPLNSWVWTVIVTVIICIIYVAAGRRYVHRRMAVAGEKTNIDAIIGRTGIVLKDISRNESGMVKVGNEQWHARSDEDIKEGEEIVVMSIQGITLTVKKTEGGNQ